VKSEIEIRDMLEKLTEIMGNRKLLASQMVTLDEIQTLRWVLGDDESWNRNVFKVYEEKLKV
jgi:hypothetical protein